MSRRALAGLLLLMPIAAVAAPAIAQDGLAQDAQTGTPPERIDLTITSPPPRSTEEACERQREAAVVSGEIVVCGALPGKAPQPYSSREEAQDRYAAKTQGRSTPDVAGAGIFRGPATFGGICVKGILNCPKPPALFVDVTALPKAPPGSDADRISRGLAPLGDNASPRPMSAQERAELGLPAPAVDSPATPAVSSPAESAAPAAPR